MTERERGPQPTTDQAIPGARSDGDPTGPAMGLMGPTGLDGKTWNPKEVADRVGLDWLDGPTRMALPEYLLLWAERVERDRAYGGPALVMALRDAAEALGKR